MAWARLDDQFHVHRKFRRAGLDATGLYAMSLSYCACYLTDGHVADDFLAEAVPDRKRREKVLERLVEHGLFHRNGSGFAINDYLEKNPSRDQLEERRQQRTDAGLKGAKAKWRHG